MSNGFGAGLTKFSRCLIAGCTELFCHLTHPSGEFGQLFRSEQEQNDDEDYNHGRPRKIEDIGNRRRHDLNWRAFIPSYQSGEFIFPKVAVGPGKSRGQAYAPGKKIKPSRVLVLEGKVGAIQQEFLRSISSNVLND